jgi:hypothetical protein
VAAGNAIIPIIQKILPYIRAAVDALTAFFNRVALIVGILFGTSINAQASQTSAALDSAAESAGGAADAQGDLAKNTEKAGKAAKGALASFDQLNVLQQDTPSGGAGGGGAGDVGGAGGGLEFPEPDTGKFEEGLDELREKVLRFKEDFLLFFQPVTDAFGRLVEALKPLGRTLFAGLQWAWENILKPLGEWAVQSLVPAVFDLLAGAVTILNDVLIGLQPLGQWLWENFLQPLGEWAGETIIKAITQLTEWLQELHVWIGENENAWRSIIIPLAVITAAFLIITSPISLTTLAIAALVAGIVILIAYWGELKNKFDEVKSALVASGAEMGKKLSGVFAGIKDAARNAINEIIRIINGMVAGIANSFNTFASVSGAFGIALPSVGAPQIPYLAKGAVIPPNAQFAAILGDQRSGRNIEAPEGLIRQIIKEEIGTIQGEFTFKFEGSMGEIARMLKPRLDRESIRIGGSLAKGNT